MPYFPDDLIYHIHLFKDVKDTRRDLFYRCRIMRETMTLYCEQCLELEYLTYDLEWLLDDSNETGREILRAEIRDVSENIERIAALRKTHIDEARTAFNLYLAAKAVVE